MNDCVGRQLERWRNRVVLSQVTGRLLDIGCGNNRLVRRYGNGVGVDVFDWGDIDLLVNNTADLPFKDGEFETITFVAALNHIPNRNDVVRECCRLLKKGGQCIVTMLPPLLSTVWHKIRGGHDADQGKRGMARGEVYGLKKREIVELLCQNGFMLKKHKRFMFGMNSMLVFQKVY
jgi:ubiquinone/menaquinone biosynthesis C-methylase UbiE